MFLAQFQAAGKTLAKNGLITGASGNLSIRVKDKLIITRHDCVLSALTSGDLIETGVFEDDNSTPLASWELPVHRAIYISTKAGAIVHAHPPCGVALSIKNSSQKLEAEVPIVGTNCEIVPGALASEIAGEIKTHPLVMVKSHGSFAVGETLFEAIRTTLKFENNCKNACVAQSIQVEPTKE